MLTRKHKILTRKDKRNRKSKRKYSRTMNKYDTVFLKKIGQVDGNSKYPIYDVKMLEKHYYLDDSCESKGTYIGNVKDNQRHGKGIMKYNNGDIYDGHWKKDKKRHGKGILKYDNGDIYDGYWKDNVRDGKGIMKLKNGDIYDGDWEKDKQNGKGIMKFKDGFIYNGDWENNNKHDTYTQYFKSDKIVTFPNELPDKWTKKDANKAIENINEIIKKITITQGELYPEWNSVNGFEIFSANIMFSDKIPYLLEINAKIEYKDLNPIIPGIIETILEDKESEFMTKLI